MVSQELRMVSEIFDGEAPHTPSDCVAQAWGFSELLRAGEDAYEKNECWRRRPQAQSAYEISSLVSLLRQRWNAQANPIGSDVRIYD